MEKREKGYSAESDLFLFFLDEGNQRKVAAGSWQNPINNTNSFYALPYNQELTLNFIEPEGVVNSVQLRYFSSDQSGGLIVEGLRQMANN